MPQHDLEHELKLVVKSSHDLIAQTSADRSNVGCCQFVVATANQPGAIAILQLHGDCVPLLRNLTGKDSWPVGEMRLTWFDDIDEGLAVRLTEDIAQLMPHGGIRVVQRLVTRLIELGAQPAESTDTIDPISLYPEAADEFEALMLLTMAKAISPLAIDLLLDQPQRWRSTNTLSESDRARSSRLNRLITPPVVVVAGPANVGKSTLCNALLGRSMSIAMDQPGTTRDYTSGRIDLAGLVVDWHDTPGLPGLRESNDPIERKAIELAQRLINRADFLIAMTDHEQPWPQLSCHPDLRIANKCDLGQRDDVELSISALTGDHLDQLVRHVRDRLVSPDDLKHPGPWLFDKRLQHVTQ